MTEHARDRPVHTVPDYRRWAVGGMLGGAVTSVAANVAHVFVPPAGAGHAWTPEPGAVLAAVVWPMALLGASEVLARKRWARPVTRVIGGVAVLVVAVVAAVISYQHLHDLLLHYGETPLSARIGPLGIDGLMLVCSVALVAADAPAASTAPDTATSAVTPAVTGPITLASTLPRTPVLAVSALPASSASTAAVTVRVPGGEARAAPDTPSATELADALRLQKSGTHTLRGAMAELGCGQPRARRVLALAWPAE